MTYETALELTGYFASILILISLLMSSAVKLRFINAVGSVVFTVYGVLIHSYPTAFLNGICVIIDIIYIVRLLRSKLRLCAHTARFDENGLREFLQYYRNDIAHYFPDYDFRPCENQVIYVVYTQANPVGILIGERIEGAGIRVLLDYSIPKFRDCSVGQFLYRELAQAGFTHLTAQTQIADHEAYLKKVGFEAKADGFCKTLN